MTHPRQMKVTYRNLLVAPATKPHQIRIVVAVLVLIVAVVVQVQKLEQKVQQDPNQAEGPTYQNL